MTTVVPVLKHQSLLRQTKKLKKEFALIFRLKDVADFKSWPEQMQEQMN